MYGGICTEGRGLTAEHKHCARYSMYNDSLNLHSKFMRNALLSHFIGEETDGLIRVL